MAMKPVSLLIIRLVLTIGSVRAEQGFYVSAAGNDANDGLTEASAFKTLAQGIAQAQAGDIKRIILTGPLDEESEGRSDRSSVFYIRDSGEAEILITGYQEGAEGDAPQLRGTLGKGVIAITGNSRIRFENILITGGDAVLGNGGGIYGEGATITAGSGTVVQGNRAGLGGGVYVQEGAFTLEGNAVLKGNRVLSDDGGGGVFDHSTFTMQENAVICDNTGSGVVLRDATGTLGDNASITGNRCQYNGGGIAGYHSELTIRGNAQVRGNQAGRSGGGIRADNDSTLLIEGNALIEDNRAETDGGGIALYLGTAIIRGNARIQGNTAGDDGGGIYGAFADITLGENTRLTDNTSECGGGLCTELWAFTIVQDQVLVKGNKAGSSVQGGGGLCMGIDATILMKGGEVRDNQAVKGGGVYIGGGYFKHSGGIITDNAAQYGGGVYKEVGKLRVTQGDVSGNTPNDLVDTAGAER